MSRAAARKATKNQRPVLGFGVLMRALPSAGPPAGWSRGSVARRTRGRAEAHHRADHQPGDDCLADADQAVPPDHGDQHGANGNVGHSAHGEQPVKAEAAAGTETNAPRAAAIGMEDRRLGNNRRTATMTSQLTPTPTRPIR